MTARQVPESSRGSGAGILRGMALCIFVASVLGTGAELLLIDHIEGAWQILPVGLLALSILVLIVHALVRRALTLWVFRLVMVLFAFSGVLGTWLHYDSKAEFKKELNPDLAGAALFWQSIRGSSVPPVMAPAMMVQLALLGLAWTYRHPDLDGRTPAPSSQTGELQ